MNHPPQPALVCLAHAREVNDEASGGGKRHLKVCLAHAREVNDRTR